MSPRVCAHIYPFCVGAVSNDDLRLESQPHADTCQAEPCLGSTSLYQTPPASNIKPPSPSFLTEAPRSTPMTITPALPLLPLPDLFHRFLKVSGIFNQYSSSYVKGAEAWADSDSAALGKSQKAGLVAIVFSCGAALGCCMLACLQRDYRVSRDTLLKGGRSCSA